MLAGRWYQLALLGASSSTAHAARRRSMICQICMMLAAGVGFAAGHRDPPNPPTVSLAVSVCTSELRGYSGVSASDGALATPLFRQKGGQSAAPRPTGSDGVAEEYDGLIYIITRNVCQRKVSLKIEKIKRRTQQLKTDRPKCPPLPTARSEGESTSVVASVVVAWKEEG